MSKQFVCTFHVFQYVCAHSRLDFSSIILSGCLDFLQLSTRVKLISLGDVLYTLFSRNFFSFSFCKYIRLKYCLYSPCRYSMHLWITIISSIPNENLRTFWLCWLRYNLIKSIIMSYVLVDQPPRQLSRLSVWLLINTKHQVRSPRRLDIFQRQRAPMHPLNQWEPTKSRLPGKLGDKRPVRLTSKTGIAYFTLPLLADYSAK